MYSNSNSYVEYKYFWDKLTDTNGSRITSYYTNADTNYLSFSIGFKSRFCVITKIYNEVVWSGLDSWGPRSQHSCIGAPQSQNAGFLVATSDRNSPTSNTLYLRVKNRSGGQRNIGIFGPNLEGNGCNYQWTGSQPYQCYITLSRGRYTHLNWYAWDSADRLTWGYLDFE